MDKANEQALKELEVFKAQGCHMLVPTLQSLASLADGFRIITSPVQIAPHPREGDVYPHESEQWDGKKKDWKAPVTGTELVRFHAQGFQKLAIGANILWSQPKLKIDPKFPRMLCDISGAVRNTDGTWRSLPDYAGSDLDIIKEGIIAQYSYNGKFDPAKQWLVDRDFLQKRKFQQQSCITTAKNRVTTRLLGLKNTYTVKELEKPFIFVQIVFVPDMKDEYTRRLVIKSNVLQIAMANVFGQRSPDMEAEPAAVEYMGPVDAAKCREGVVDMESAGGADQTYTVKNDQPPDAPPFLTTEAAAELETAESLRLDFGNCDEADQCRILTAMIEKKGQRSFVENWFKTFPGGKKPMSVEQIGAENRLRLYDRLVQEPDKEGGKA